MDDVQVGDNDHDTSNNTEQGQNTEISTVVQTDEDHSSTINKDEKVDPTIALKVKPNQYAIKPKIVLKAQLKTISKIDPKKVTMSMDELQDEPNKKELGNGQQEPHAKSRIKEANKRLEK
eukprot:5195766-Ditylum_brightwellii.AAC.1